MLTVQVDGVEYPKNKQGGPIYPVFKTEELSWDLKDAILRTLMVDEAAVEGGPVFRDFAPRSNSEAPQETMAVEPAAPVPADAVNPARVWTLVDGSQFEAEYITVVGDKMVVKTLPRGRQKKIPMNTVSAADREFIELANPPEFSLDFIKLSSSIMDRYELSPMEIQWGRELPRVNDFSFGAKVRQTGARPYNHELELEYFALGKEMIGNAYILVDHGSSTFTPTKENKRSHEFKSDRKIEFREYTQDDTIRGERFAESLVLLKDKRGEVIAYKATSPWLWENLDNLRKIRIGSFMNDECVRIHPTSPKPTRY